MNRDDSQYRRKTNLEMGRLNNLAGLWQTDFIRINRVFGSRMCDEESSCAVSVLCCCFRHQR